MVEKVVKGWLIVDVSKGSMRVLKKLSSGSRALKPAEIAIELKLDIDVPEKPTLKAEGKITLSKTQLANMMISQLTDASQEEIK